MNVESLQKQSESALSLHFVSLIQVFKHFGRTGGQGAEGAACGDGEVVATAVVLAGVSLAGGLPPEPGVVLTISKVDGTHCVQTVLILVLVIVDVVCTVCTIVLPSEVVV